MKNKQTSSLVEALLCSFNVDFEDLLDSHKAPSLPLQVLWIICCDVVHPVLFGFNFLRVAVIVIYLKVINHPNSHKLWEVWDSRRRSVEILQRVSDCKKKLKSSCQFLFDTFINHWTKLFSCTQTQKELQYIQNILIISKTNTNIHL